MYGILAVAVMAFVMFSLSWVAFALFLIALGFLWLLRQMVSEGPGVIRASYRASIVAGTRTGRTVASASLRHTLYVSVVFMLMCTFAGLGFAVLIRSMNITP